MGRLLVPAFVSGRYHPGIQRRGSCLRGPTNELMLLSRLLDSVIGSTRGPSHCGMNTRSPVCMRGRSMGCPCADLQGFRRPWVQTLDMTGFEPSDISAKVEEDKIIVHARHEERDGDDFSLSEKYRSIAIPEGVNKEKVACFLDDAGTFIIKGTFVPKRNCTAGEKDSSKNVATGTSKPPADKPACEPDSVPVEILQNQTTETDPSVAPNGTPEEEEKQFGEIVQGEMKVTDGALTKVDAVNQQATDETDDIHTDVEVTEMPDRSESPVPSEEQALEKTNDAEKDIEIAEVGALAPLMDETQVVEEGDNGRQFQVRINLANFKPGDISVRRQDDKLAVDARKEWNCEGVYTSQEVHRTYPLPPEACKKAEAVAKMSENGLLLVSVPMDNARVSNQDAE